MQLILFAALLLVGFSDAHSNCIYIPSGVDMSYERLNLIFSASCYRPRDYINITLSFPMIYDSFLVNTENGRFSTGYDYRFKSFTDRQCVEQFQNSQRYSASVTWIAPDDNSIQTDFEGVVFTPSKQYSQVFDSLPACARAPDDFNYNKIYSGGDCTVLRDSDPVLCPTWVKDSPSNCKDHSAYVYSNCNYTCCMQKIPSKPVRSDCYMYKDEDNRCPTFVTQESVACDRTSSYEAVFCKASCCKEGFSVFTTTTTTTTFSPVNMNDCYTITDKEIGCESWVKSDPSKCSSDNSYEAANCPRSCCMERMRPTGRRSKTTRNERRELVHAQCRLYSDSNPAHCPSWAKEELCNRPFSFESLNCRYSCCLHNQVIPTQDETRDCWSLADIDPRLCPGWVSTLPENCWISTSYEHNQCRRSCCAAAEAMPAWLRAFYSNSKTCYELRDKDNNCPDWVSADRSSCDTDNSYEAVNCAFSCCNERKKGGNNRKGSVDFSNDKTNTPQFCEQDFHAGYCPRRSSQWEESRDMWYHCPHCYTCKKFRYSGCGGNQNRFETREECERVCERKNVNPWTRYYERKFGSNEKVGCSNLVDKDVDCISFVKTDPTRCGYRTWEQENCPKACCNQGYNNN